MSVPCLDVFRAKEAEELRNKIERAKTKRLLQEKLVKNNLSTIEDEEDESLLSAADWVKRSRLKATEPKIDVKPQVKKVPLPVSYEDEYTSDQLKGLKVMHDVTEFEEGREIILTLADTSILKKDERGRIIGVAEDEDVLENIQISEEMKRQELERRKKRARQPIYGGYDDEEFADGAMPGAKRSILSHYDKEEKSGPKFVIGSESSFHLKSEAKAANAPSAISLQRSDRPHDMSDDFYSASEVATFKKRNTDKVKKTRRMKHDDDNEEKEVDLDAILAEPSSSTSKDRGSRNKASSSSRIDEVTANAMKRQENYNKAVKAAELKTKLAFAGKEPREKVDILLQESIERLQRLKDARKDMDVDKKPNEITDRGAAFALDLLERQKALQGGMDHAVNEMKTEDALALDEIDTEGRRKDGTLIFSSTTEFTARLQAQLNDKARSQAEKAILNEHRYVKGKRPLDGLTSLSSLPEPTDKKKMQSISSGDNLESMDVDGEQDEEDSEGNAMEEDDDENDDDDQLGFLHHQPLASRSTAAALALLKGSGDLKTKTMLAGRAKDARDNSLPIDEKKVDGVKIEYRDEFGRELTKKEAYRQLCYRFHGYGPGKMKKDKRLKVSEAVSMIPSVTLTFRP
jgi:U4/U6.U5 tri-snRNP-associated protein 1